MKSFAAKLWAMQGPEEGTLVYGIRLKGESEFTMCESIQEALRLSAYAIEVREFWRL